MDKSAGAVDWLLITTRNHNNRQVITFADECRYSLQELGAVKFPEPPLQRGFVIRQYSTSKRNFLLSRNIIFQPMVKQEIYWRK